MTRAQLDYIFVDPSLKFKEAGTILIDLFDHDYIFMDLCITGIEDVIRKIEKRKISQPQIEPFCIL